MATPSAQHSLNRAVQAADARVTLLDDKLDLENAAIYKWLKAHRLHGSHLHSLVLGYEALTPAWRASCLPFISEIYADQLLRSVKGDIHPMSVLRTLASYKWGLFLVAMMMRSY